MDRRPLLLLTLGVAALHAWLLLQGPWAPTPPAEPLRAEGFSTRSLPPPAPPAPPPPPPVRATPRPAPRLPPPPPVQEAIPAPQPAQAEPPPATDESFVVPADTESAAAADAPATAEPAVPDAPQQAEAPEATPPPDTPATALPPQLRGGPDQPVQDGPLAVQLPPAAVLDFAAQGQVKGLNYTASAQLRWQHDGQHYEAQQEIKAFLLGRRVQTSRGALGPQGLEPERFGDKSRSERAAHFDQAQHKATFSDNSPDAPIGPGAQDRLSIFLQLAALVAGDPGRFPPGAELTLTTVSARAADRWTFRVQGEEQVDLPLGPRSTLKLERLPRKEYDQKAELWLAPALAYLPVRIRLSQDNGDVVDLQLRAHSSP